MLTEPNQIDVHVGARMRARRLLLQMSEAWLAGMLTVPEAAIDDMESGRVRIDHPTLMQLCAYLEVPERYFYLGIGDTPTGAKKRLPWIRDVDRWFAEHVFPHEGLFYGTALRLTGEVEAAREILHEAYAELLTGSRWSAIVFPKAYVLKAIRSLAVKRTRRARIVRIDLLADMDALNTTDTNPDSFEIVSAKQRRDIALAAIEELPPQCRRVVKLRRLKEMLPRDIAQEMGISLSMVEKHLAKGLLHVADRLGERMPARRPRASEDTRDVAGE